MKYEFASKRPLQVGDRLLGPAALHAIEAIGKGYGATITALSEHFIVTKGATSQIIAKLATDGFVRKSKQNGNRRETRLELTPKGRNAFKTHERYGAPTLRELLRIMHRYPEKDIDAFLRVLTDIDCVFAKSIAR